MDDKISLSLPILSLVFFTPLIIAYPGIIYLKRTLYRISFILFFVAYYILLGIYAFNKDTPVSHFLMAALSSTSAMKLLVFI
jgi:hypothetical protein